jgi:hypothetical protein
MIDKTELYKKSLAIIAVNVDSKEEDNVVVYSGIVNLKDEKIYFHRDGNDLFEITDWQDRIKIVSQDVKEILLNCEYSLTLSIGDLPKDENPEEYNQTGLKWIDKNEEN